MEPAEKHQKQLLEHAQRTCQDSPLSQATRDAYMACPRHLFLPRYRRWGNPQWHEVTTDNLAEHLPTLYDDRPLILFGDDDDNVPSTISQPSFVLRLLDLLKVEPGHKVFELGAGSGWNAAMLGWLVGPQGHVHSLEIIPEVARQATANLAALGISNVSVIEADAGEGYVPAAPYDRAIFTAGTYDLPRHFYSQLREGGLLLAVIKCEGGGDSLFVLRKEGDHFCSLKALQCGFVQMTGRYRIDSLDPVCLEALPQWSDLQQREVDRTPFWWAGQGRHTFMWRTLSIRAFLAITEPLFRSFKTRRTETQPREEPCFGLWDEPNGSLVVARDDCLISYGSTAAREQLLRDVQCWVTLGMPTTTCMGLQVWPIDMPLTAGPNQWIVHRRESQFLWTLPRGTNSLTAPQSPAPPPHPPA